jgi:sulfatase maturation enzyme AslB (radical SAM superfamily)
MLFLISLVMKPLFVNYADLARIKNGEVVDTEYSELLNHNIYIEDAEQDRIAFAKLREYVHSLSKQVSILYLITSTACNLSCKYCFLDNNPNTIEQRTIMAEPDATAAIDKFFSQVDFSSILEPQIIIYGGEPLTNKKVVISAFRYAHKNWPNAKLTLITNGTLLDEEVASCLAENIVGFGISLDGPKWIKRQKTESFKDASEQSVYDADY